MNRTFWNLSLTATAAAKAINASLVSVLRPVHRQLPLRDGKGGRGGGGPGVESLGDGRRRRRGRLQSPPGYRTGRPRLPGGRRR